MTFILRNREGGRCPKKSVIPHPLGHRRQVALRWAARRRAGGASPPNPPFPRQCSTVSIWAADNHHANLGLQTLSINLEAKPCRSGSFPGIISHYQEFLSFQIPRVFKTAPRTTVWWRQMNQNQNHLPVKARLPSHLAATLTINTNQLMTGAVAPGLSSISD